ncbi:MAG: limonene 1,2-monooxygenase, partial [Actinomycetota bacterium]
DWHQTLRSYELVAERVMPHFNEQLSAPQASYDRVVGAGSRWVDATLGAQLTAIADYEAVKASR